MRFSFHFSYIEEEMWPRQLLLTGKSQDETWCTICINLLVEPRLKTATAAQTPKRMCYEEVQWKREAFMWSCKIAEWACEVKYPDQDYHVNYP